MPGIFRQTEEANSEKRATLKLSAQTGTSINRLRNTEGADVGETLLRTSGIVRKTKTGKQPKRPVVAL
jgi:hypothetical protein